jgi:hypothetical protein
LKKKDQRINGVLRKRCLPRFRAGFQPAVGPPALQYKCNQNNELGQVQAAVRDLVLQSGGELIDVTGGDVHGHAILQKWRAVAAD